MRVLLQVRQAMAFTVPSFIGLFAGANAAHNLRSPYTSIPRGLFAAIATSTLLYSVIFILMGGVADRSALSLDFLLFEQVLQHRFGTMRTHVLGHPHPLRLPCVQIAWPTFWVTTAAMLAVGVGAALHLLSVAPHIVQQLAEENVVPGFQRCSLYATNRYFSVTYRRKKGLKTSMEESVWDINVAGIRINPNPLLESSCCRAGIPVRATCASLVLALLFVSLPGLETIGLVVTILFLLTYMITNLSCAIMSFYSAPSWRPTFQLLIGLMLSTCTVHATCHVSMETWG